MDKLERFILQNKDEFDIYEPSAELWNKINPNNKKRKVIKFSVKKVLYRVAAVIAIFMASYLAQEYMHRNDTNIAESEKQEIEIPELLEAEIYYTSAVNNTLNQVNMYLVKCPEMKEDLNYDLAELDSVYSELKNDLKDDVANQEVVEAMIQNYRLKLQILEDILYELERKNDEPKNNNSNEVQI